MILTSFAVITLIALVMSCVELVRVNDPYNRDRIGRFSVKNFTPNEAQKIQKNSVTWMSDMRRDCGNA